MDTSITGGEWCEDGSWNFIEPVCIFPQLYWTATNAMPSLWPHAKMMQFKKAVEKYKEDHNHIIYSSKLHKPSQPSNPKIKMKIKKIKRNIWKA